MRKPMSAVVLECSVAPARGFPLLIVKGSRYNDPIRTRFANDFGVDLKMKVERNKWKTF